jgi:hypothetical protein
MQVYTNDEIVALVTPIEDLCDRQITAREKHLELIAQGASVDEIEAASDLAEALVDQLCEDESELCVNHSNRLGMSELADRLSMIARFQRSSFPCVTWGHSEVFELAAAACRASLNKSDEWAVEDQRVSDLKRELARTTLPEGMPAIKYIYSDGTSRNYGDPPRASDRDLPVQTLYEFYPDPYSPVVSDEEFLRSLG